MIRFAHLNRWVRAGALGAALVMFLAATGTGIDPANAQEFSIKFEWPAGMAACMSPVSPAIELANVPEGTARLVAKMVDLDFTGFNHGGGAVAYDGAPAIAEGVLTDGYRGPCPPNPHRYRFTVKALGADGGVLATSSHTEKFPK